MLNKYHFNTIIRFITCTVLKFQTYSNNDSFSLKCLINNNKSSYFMSFQIVGKKMLFYILIDKYKVEKVNKKNKFLVNCENQKPI